MAAPAAVLSVLVRANTSQATTGLMRFNTQLGATEGKANKALGAVKTLAKGAALGAAGGMAYAVKKAADFEQQLDNLGAVSNASGRQMERFRRQAMRAGAATKFSALDAAKAQTELAKGGLSVSQIMKGGLKASLALASAGELELADAAETTANAIKLFGLEGKDSMKVADALATAANKTTADVSDFAMALKQGGGVAKMAGLSFTETVLALEALAETGVRNSDAGTSMKTAFIQLLKPSAKQAELAKELGLNFVNSAGSMKNMSQISEMLRAKLGGMTKAQRTAALATLAGQDGVRTLNALYAAGPAKLDGMRKGLDKTGTAALTAAKKQDNLKGKLENLQGSIETIAISIGSKMLPSLTKAAEKITDILNDPKLTASEKFDKLAEMGGKALEKAIPIVAKASAKLAVVAAKAFVTGFLNAGIWGRLIIGGFLLSKMGGLGAFTALGRRGGTAAGPAMGTSMGAGMRAGLMSSVPGMLAAFAAVVGPELRKVGSDNLTFSDFAKGTAGLPKFTKGDADSTENFKQLSIWVKNSKIGLQELNTELVRYNGTELAADKRTELRNMALALDKVRFRFDGLRSGAYHSLSGITRAANQNFAAISKYMGTHTARGRAAVERNFKAAAGAISRSMASGEISTKAGMAGMLKLLKSHSLRGRDALTGNYRAMSRQIDATMRKGGKLTKEGMEYMEAVLVAAMKDLGLSSDSIRMSLNKRESAKDGPVQPGQTGLMVTGGKPHGDSVHALLERGEVVINRRAVKKMGGAQHVNQINQMLPRFQGGGIPLASLSGQAGNVQTYGNIALTKHHRAAEKKLRQERKKMEEAATGGGGGSSTTGLIPQVKRAIAWARKHGWHGQVNSGFRTRAEQEILYARYLAGGNLAAKPGTSEHEKGRAIDVSDYQGFLRAMGSAPANSKLKWFGPGDSVHFSMSGHQLGGIVGMQKGGVVAHAAKSNWPRALSAMQNARFRGGALKTGLAVGGAESGGYTKFVGDGGDSVSPWQINLPSHPQYSRSKLLSDWTYAAKAAHQISGGGTNWNPWTMFRNGGYRSYLGKAAATISAGGGGTGGGGKPTKKQTKKQRAAAKKLSKRLKRIKGIGLSKKTEGLLAKLKKDATIYGEYADRAGTLTTEKDGVTTAGIVEGQTETQWLGAQLSKLFSLRNLLIKAEASVVKKRGATTHELEKAYEWLKGHPASGVKKGRDPVAGWKGVSPATGSMNAWNKIPIKRRKERMAKFLRQGGRLPSDRRFLSDGRVAADKSGAARKRQRADYTKKIIPALKSARTRLSTRRGELLGDLEAVQGVAAPMGLLKALPAIGVLGGDIFSAQNRLRELGEKATATDTSPAVDTGRADLLAELLRQSNLRTLVSQRQYEVFKNFPPFGGQFEKGGMVPGPVGAPRMILAHGGETVTPNGANLTVIVNGDISNVPKGKDPVEAVLGDRRFKVAVQNARVSPRASLPGRGGGV